MSSQSVRRTVPAAGWASIRKSGTLLLFLLLSVGSSRAHAYFGELGYSVRAMGMGGPHVALADDVTASLTNPGGLHQVRRPELIMAAAFLHTGLDAMVFDGRTDHFGQHLIGYAQPLCDTTLAVTGLIFDTLFYDEYTLVWSQSFPVTENVGIGASLKLLHARIAETPYTALDPDLATLSRSQTGVTLDVGGLYKLTPRFRLGLRASNVRAVRMNWLDREQLPATVVIGVAHRYRDGVQLLDALVQEDGSVQCRWGVEYWFFSKHLALRTGTDFRGLMTGWSIRNHWRGTEWQVDYALLYPLGSVEETLGSHRFALVTRF